MFIKPGAKEMVSPSVKAPHALPNSAELLTTVFLAIVASEIQNATSINKVNRFFIKIGFRD
jgi:hypothetical protein